MPNGPLSGIRVLDLSRVLAGPYCTMILGDLGADVIKVEAPGGSDDTRAWGPPYVKSESAYYLCANRNKKALTLDLKSEAGQKVLHRLIANSDVLIHNFKTGTMEKWGLDEQTLSETYPQLVYCQITGFGQTGPLSHLPGYDFAIQAMSGFMSITGSESSGPMKVGVAITDIITGLYANIGIQAALLERKESGLGQSIDLSLYDSAVSALVNVGSNYLVSGKVPKPLGNYHPNIVPYQMFKTQDGEMVVAVGNDRQFQAFCIAIGSPGLGKDPRFITNSDRLSYRDELEVEIDKQLLTKPTDLWITILREMGIPCGPIQSIDQVLQDPHLLARDMIVKQKHTNGEEIALVGNPLKLSRTKVTYGASPPLVGEHTKELLENCGYTDEEIRALAENHVI